MRNSARWRAADMPPHTCTRAGGWNVVCLASCGVRVRLPTGLRLLGRAFTAALTYNAAAMAAPPAAAVVSRELSTALPSPRGGKSTGLLLAISGAGPWYSGNSARGCTWKADAQANTTSAATAAPTVPKACVELCGGALAEADGKGCRGCIPVAPIACTRGPVRANGEGCFRRPRIEMYPCVSLPRQSAPKR